MNRVPLAAVLNPSSACVSIVALLLLIRSPLRNKMAFEAMPHPVVYLRAPLPAPAAKVSRYRDR